MRFIQSNQHHQVYILTVILYLLLSEVQGDCNAPPEIPRARVSPPGPRAVFSEGEWVTYSCRRGFLPRGESTIQCSGGNWTDASFQCTGVVCGDPGAPDNGERIGTVYHFGSQVEFRCDEGYSLIGRRISFCQANQRWSYSVPTCKASTCPPVQAPAHGRVFPNNRATLDTQVRYTCDDNFRWTGDERRTCQSDGTWSGEDGICAAHCDPLEVPDNVIYEPRNRTTTGVVVTFRCSRGFRMIGPNWTNCTDEGRWSYTSPTCRAVSCGDPGIPVNGRRIGSLFAFGSMVTFQCDPRYQMRGRRTTFCNAGQRWSNPVPYCKAMQCPWMGSPDHGRVFPSGALKAGTMVRYSCEWGYRWTGSPTRTCLPNGVWAGRHGTCEVVNCGIPMNLEANSVTYEPKNHTDVGAVVRFRCTHWARGLEGAAVAECGLDGLWSNPTPQCMLFCTNNHILEGRWEDEDANTGHGQSKRFWCETEHYYPKPQNKTVTCQNGVWIPQPRCEYFKRPWGCGIDVLNVFQSCRPPWFV